MLFEESLSAACAMAQNLAANGNERCKMSLNIAGASLVSRNLAKSVLETCKRHKADSNQIILEIFEDTSPIDVKKAVPCLKKLILQGIGISVDDAPTSNSLKILDTLTRNDIGIYSVKVDGKYVVGLSDPQEGPARRLTIEGVARVAAERARYLTLEGAPYFTVKDLDVARELAKSYGQCTWLLQSPPPSKSIEKK